MLSISMSSRLLSFMYSTLSVFFKFVEGYCALMDFISFFER